MKNKNKLVQDLRMLLNIKERSDIKTIDIGDVWGEDGDTFSECVINGVKVILTSPSYLDYYLTSDEAFEKMMEMLGLETAKAIEDLVWDIDKGINSLTEEYQTMLIELSKEADKILYY